ncbi:MAG: undecaprenyl-diphosphate phosphatase [Firmicutes bacterium]|nr:undecaprenyl-diphosphate phosphatase [Bacillota bacterium]
MLDILRALILGIVEGITEWLPISSTGHLILVQEFIGTVVSEDFKEMFDVVIQLGAIMAVVVLYFHKLNPFAPSKSKEEKKKTFELWFKVAAACVPAAVIGFLLDDWMDAHLYNAFVVALTLIGYGIWFIAIESGKKKAPKTDDLDKLTYKTALIIGAFQVLALVPGTSRSGSTIIGGMLSGCSRFVATEFTFFLAIPVMFGASLLKLVKFFVKGGSFTLMQFGVLGVGMVVSFAVSVLAIKFLIGYVKKNDFKAFGVYRIILGALVLVYFGAKMLWKF